VFVLSETVVWLIGFRVIRVHAEWSLPSVLPAGGPSVQGGGTLQKQPPLTDMNAQTTTKEVESNAAAPQPVETFKTIFDRLAKPKNPLKKVERTQSKALS